MKQSTTRIWCRDPAAFFLTKGAYQQSYVVASLSRSEETFRAAEELYCHLAEILESENQAIVHERIFGSLDAEPAVMAARRRALQSRGFAAKGPFTYVQGRPPWGKGLAGVIVRSVSRVGEPSPVEEAGRPRGFQWCAGDLRFLVLQDIQDTGGDGRRNRPAQIRHLIERAEKLLRSQGATYRQVVRTWFYLSDILDWYDSFNEARTAKYLELGVLPAQATAELVLPASTGIEGTTPLRSAGVLDLLALCEPPGRPSIVRRLSNVGQKEAFQYGSAFSRGVLIGGDDLSIIEVSGTAAIDERGQSLHRGRFDAQVEATLGKVASLLEPQGARPEDIAATTVFVKRAEDAPRFWDVAKAHGLGDLPAVCVVADVCRGELLFEMDASVVYASPERTGTER